MIDVDGDLLLSAWSWYLQRESATAARMLGKPTSKQGRNARPLVSRPFGIPGRGMTQRRKVKRWRREKEFLRALIPSFG